MSSPLRKIGSQSSLRSLLSQSSLGPDAFQSTRTSPKSAGQKLQSSFERCASAPAHISCVKQCAGFDLRDPDTDRDFISGGQRTSRTLVFGCGKALRSSSPAQTYIFNATKFWRWYNAVIMRPRGSERFLKYARNACRRVSYRDCGILQRSVSMEELSRNGYSRHRRRSVGCPWSPVPGSEQASPAHTPEQASPAHMPVAAHAATTVQAAPAMNRALSSTKQSLSREPSSGELVTYLDLFCLLFHCLLTLSRRFF